MGDNSVEDTIKVMTRNAVKCLSCNTVLESKHRHDYQACYCSNRAFVDGGLSYIRLGAMNLDLIEDLSEYTTYDKVEYEKLQQERKERQRNLNENSLGGSKVSNLFGERYGVEVIDLLIEKGLLDSAFKVEVRNET